MDVPPPRWRVEERGRRLVVIDRGDRGSAAPRMVAGQLPKTLARPFATLGFAVVRIASLGATTHDGDSIFTTPAVLDERAPREIVVDRTDAGIVGLFVVLLSTIVIGVVTAALFEPEALVGGAAIAALSGRLAGAALRRRATALFDRMQERASHW